MEGQKMKNMIPANGTLTNGMPCAHTNSRLKRQHSIIKIVRSSSSFVTCSSVSAVAPHHNPKKPYTHRPRPTPPSYIPPPCKYYLPQPYWTLFSSCCYPLFGPPPLDLCELCSSVVGFFPLFPFFLFSLFSLVPTGFRSVVPNLFIDIFMHFHPAKLHRFLVLLFSSF